MKELKLTEDDREHILYALDKKFETPNGWEIDDLEKVIDVFEEWLILSKYIRKEEQLLECYSCGAEIKNDIDGVRPECYCNDCLPNDKKLLKEGYIRNDSLPSVEIEKIENQIQELKDENDAVLHLDRYNRKRKEILDKNSKKIEGLIKAIKTLLEEQP